MKKFAVGFIQGFVLVLGLGLTTMGCSSAKKGEASSLNPISPGSGNPPPPNSGNLTLPLRNSLSLLPATDQELLDAARSRVIARGELNLHQMSLGGLENVMRGQVSQSYKDSINRLDLRYFKAVPEANLIYQTVLAFVNHYELTGNEPESQVGARRIPARLGPDGTTILAPGLAIPSGSVINQWKLRHARTFLHMLHRNFASRQEPNTALTMVETLALVWTATCDQSVYDPESTLEERQWRFIESLAFIRRGHNHVQDDPDLEIEWVFGVDQPTCFWGSFKKLLEPLVLLHPDIAIDTVLSRQELIDEIRIAHRIRFPELNDIQQAALRETVESLNHGIDHYAQMALEELRRDNPNSDEINVGQIERDVQNYIQNYNNPAINLNNIPRDLATNLRNYCGYLSDLERQIHYGAGLTFLESEYSNVILPTLAAIFELYN